jgi:hypothetical protein
LLEGHPTVCLPENSKAQQTTNMASSDRFVVAVSEEEILYIISNIFAKPQVFYYLIFDAKIFDIIYQLYMSI